jgi:hypothetical protein
MMNRRKKMKDLGMIDKELIMTREFVGALIGTPDLPRVIENDKEMAAAQDNVLALNGLRKEVEAYFKPIKEEARAPYEKVLEKEKAWLSAVNTVFTMIDNGIKKFNQQKRLEIQAREQAEAEERARMQRERLAREAAELTAAGNTQGVEAVTTQIENTVAGPVAEKKMMSRTEIGTMSESETIEDFQITNELEFIQACIDAGFGHILVTDKKSHTSFKKILTTSIKDTNKFPGCSFRRDWKTNYRSK